CQAEDGIRDWSVTGVQTCALPISLGPMRMDDWEVGDPGCATTRQGDPCTTAYEWRYRLVQEINRLFPPTAKNIILIGHSTGARRSEERRVGKAWRSREAETD